MSQPERLPDFAELPVKAGHPPRSALGVFGDDDQIGTLNLLTPERVAADCALDGRYEFFFTSAPLNKRGGVASPPNALAIK